MGDGVGAFVGARLGPLFGALLGVLNLDELDIQPIKWRNFLTLSKTKEGDDDTPDIIRDKDGKIVTDTVGWGLPKGMDADEKPDPNAEPMTPDKFKNDILAAFADKTKHFDDIEKEFDEKDEKMIAEIKKNKDNFERLDEIEKELEKLQVYKSYMEYLPRKSQLPLYWG